MDITWSESFKKKKDFYKWASALALITIVYNLFEGTVSVFFGLQDETLSLFGFGLDSFVEVVSGAGIWHMVRRMKYNETSDHDMFEKRALRITGGAFYILAAGLAVTSVMNLYKGSRPETTFWGVVVSIISICIMWALIHYKLKLGRQYNSQAMIADANCSMVCMYLSIILLVSSLGFEITGFGMLDSIGGLGIAFFSLREGREALAKAAGEASCGCKGNCH